MSNIKEINGKTLIFTDCHLGLKQNSILKINIVVKVFTNILKYVKNNNVENIIFAGDAFHDRRTIDVNTLNVGLKLFSALASFCNMYLIVGNHDMHFKTSTEINSINIFKSNPKIHIISVPTPVLLNNKKCLLVPWASDLSEYKENEFDFLIGHFDINEKFLIATYINEHSLETKTADAIKTQICSDELLKSVYSDFSNLDDSIESSLSKKNVIDLGDFVSLVKKNGTIFTGHIHEHKEFVSKQRKIIFIGSPYQQNFGEINSIDGFYILDENCDYSFIELTGIPKHIKIYFSEILKTGIDNFDFSIVKNNIVKKIYDIEVSKEDEAKILQKINDTQPYEEVLSEYEINVSSQLDQADNEYSAEILGKSKLDYVRYYIDNIDDKILEENKIDREKLFSILKTYYELVENETNI